MDKQRSAVVLDIEPLNLVCAIGQLDVQAQVHLLSEYSRGHGGLEEGRFHDRVALPGLIGSMVRKVAKQANLRVSAIAVSVPPSYIQTYMHIEELPVYGQVREAQLEEMLLMSEAVLAPAGYRRIRTDVLAWEVDGAWLRHSPAGTSGRLLKGYFSLTYADDGFCRQMQELVQAAGFRVSEHLPLPCALTGYASYRWNLLDTFLLIDSDEISTCFLGAQRGKLWLKKELPFGLQSLIREEIQATGCSYEEARNDILSCRLGPRGKLSPLSLRIGARIQSLLQEAEQALRPSAISLNDPIVVVLSGNGWTGIPGMEDLVHGIIAAESVLSMDRESPVNEKALLHQVLAQEQVYLPG